MNEITRNRAKNCVTHHYACDCREWHRRQMEEALLEIELLTEATMGGFSKLDNADLIKITRAINKLATAGLYALENLDSKEN